VSLTLSADTSSGAGTGIARFASVDPRLAGGSLPSTAGLGWLVEKGYRTVLDLRESAEVSPTFIAEVAKRGLRYVALPVSLKSLDSDRLARFQFELAAPEARPLFFFDSEGSRAGALWYIRRVTQDHVDPQLARREAEDIGLKTQDDWRLATDYIQKLEADRPRPTPIRTGAAAMTSPPAAASVPSGLTAQRSAVNADAEVDRDREPLLAVTADAQAERPDPSNPPVQGLTKSSPFTPLPAAPSESGSPREPLNWRPFAAMLVTGLSLPLAYWTRTVIPDAIARARASLPGPGPARRSLPLESGE
jgi:protein tyrosine phosphatase (PTP) superfamily phosphohydrolase (DUF442 family)